jgi:hypothetical protein
MAIAVVMQFPGGTKEQYDEVITKLGYTSGGPGEPGGLFHWITFTDEGPRLTDVWESREVFDKFAQEKMGPAVEAAGVPGPPTFTFYEVYNYLTAG